MKIIFRLISVLLIVFSTNHMFCQNTSSYLGQQANFRKGLPSIDFEGKDRLATDPFMVASFFSLVHQDSIYFIAEYKSEVLKNIWTLAKSERQRYNLMEVLKYQNNEGIINLNYSYPSKDSIIYLTVNIDIVHYLLTYEYSRKEKFKLDFRINLSLINSWFTYDLYRASYYKDFSKKIYGEHFNAMLFGLYLNWLYHFGNNAVELRPGLIFGKAYTGLEIGLFYRKTLFKGLYGNIGINYHYNILYESGNSVGYSTEETTLLNPSLGLGYELSDKIILHILYEHTNNHLIYSNHDFSNLDPKRGYRYIKGLLRFIFEINI